MTRVSFLVVSYTGHERLTACLDGIDAAREGVDAETIMVVNGVEMRAEHRAAEARGATLLHSPVNLGFAGGLQYARSAASGEHLAIVQDDVLVDRGWLHPVLDVLEREPTVGAVGCRMLLPDGDLYGLGMFTDRDLRTHLFREPPSSATEWAVDACFSAACLVRASAWDGVGGPNHRLFPLWMVDTDLCLGLQESGWSVMTTQRAVAHHRRHSSTTSWARRHLDERNQRILARNHRELLLSRRRSAEPDDLEHWIERCATAATQRREHAPPHPPRRAPVPFEQLVRDARRDARSVRRGYRMFRVRSAIGYRLRGGWRRVTSRPPA